MITNKSSKSRAPLLLAMLAASSIHPPADHRYIGPDKGPWGVDDRWDPKGIPGHGDNASLTGAPARSVNLDVNYCPTCPLGALTDVIVDGPCGWILVQSVPSEMWAVSEIVGKDAFGAYLQSDGTSTLSGDSAVLALGENPHSRGEYQIVGGSLTITSKRHEGGLLVGRAGIGKFNLSQSGAVSVQADVSVGLDSGTAGQAVPGYGIIVQTGGSFTIGTQIAGGGRSLFLGRQPGSVGCFQMCADAPSCVLTVNGNIQVGSSSEGTFIQRGGTVDVRSMPGDCNQGDVIVGNDACSSGYYVVGSNDNFVGTLLANAVFVGGDATNEGGTGTLSIGVGGIVNAGVKVYSRGTLDLQGGGINAASSSCFGGTVINGHLTGSGSITGDVTANGYIAPDDSHAGGPLFISGNLTLSGNNVLVIRADSQGIRGSIKVSGSATLGGTLELNGACIAGVGKELTFLAANSLAGKFTNVSMPSSPGAKLVVQYGPNSVSVSATP